MIISRRHATLEQLQTYYGAPDAYDLYEIIVVDNYNERRMSEAKD